MKKFLTTISILALGVTLGACGKGDSQQEKASTTKEVTTLKLGVMPSTDNIPLVLAHEKGFDKKHGVEIQLETFKAANDRDAAFQAGQVDGINSDLVALAIYRQAGMDVKITGSTYGEFDLVSGDESVQQVTDLKGKEVLFARNTGTEYAVYKILQKEQMTLDDIRVTEVLPVPTRLELLKNQQAAAAIMPEPFVTMAKADGLRVLNSTREIGVNPFIMTMTSEVIKEKADAIKGMYEAYNEAVDWMKEHDKSEYIQLFIDEIGFPESLKDQIQVPDYPHAQQTTAADIEEAFKYATQVGLLKEDLKPADVLSDVYFK